MVHSIAASSGPNHSPSSVTSAKCSTNTVAVSTSGATIAQVKRPVAPGATVA